ncbi:MAG: diaminopimelate epimerase [Gammaproteobacteria bacterium]
MQLHFTKMHGLGNDFVVLDGIHQNLQLSKDHLRHLAHRHFGIGCDQILLVETATRADVDFRYRIFNADGGEVEQCGNGARCFARFVLDKGLTTSTEIAVETQGGRIVLKVESDGQITVDMGVPDFEPAALPCLTPKRQLLYPLEVNGRELQVGLVSMGNPHAVLQVERIGTAPVETLGPALESHANFPRRINVGFMQIVDPGHIMLRVYERGVGETLACGTGACAAVAIGRQWDRLSDTVRVSLPGGDLEIRWAGEGKHLFMTGPAATVFEGRITL